MSEKWTTVGGFICDGKGQFVADLTDAMKWGMTLAEVEANAECIVTAVNRDKLFDKMEEFVEGIANHGACRGFSVDMVRCTAEARCSQCLSCEARDLLADIDKENKP